MKTKYIATIEESECFIFEENSIYIWDKFSSMTDNKVKVEDPLYKIMDQSQKLCAN